MRALQPPLQMVIGGTRGPINIFSMGGVIFVIGMHVFPFTYFMTHNALRSIDASYEEAARLLGARRWGVLLKVNLPLVAPAITGGALLSAIDSMALFGPQAFLGLPAQITFLPTRIYGVIGSYPPRWAEASALSIAAGAAHRLWPDPPAFVSRPAFPHHGRRSRPAARNRSASGVGNGRCSRSAARSFPRRHSARRSAGDRILKPKLGERHHLRQFHARGTSVRRCSTTRSRYAAS